MIEAYEIGIRLALDDGVSAGVDAIRRDLVSLNQVIDASLANLGALRQAAAALVAPIAPEPRARKEQQPVDPSGSDEATAPRNGAEPSAPAAIIVPAHAAPPAAPIEAPFVEPAGVTAPVQHAAPQPAQAIAFDEPTQRAPEAAAPPPIQRVAVIEAMPQVAPSLPSAKASSSGLPMSAAAAAPATDGRPDQDSPAAPVPFLAPLKPQIIGPRADAVPVGPGLPPAAPAMPPLRDLRFEAAAPPAPLVVEASRASAAAPSHAAAAVFPASVAAAASSRLAPDLPPSAPPSKANAATEGFGEQSAMSVHVYLDGAPLSRWMMDHLGRAASRPTASSTAFDPRIGPAWPGASIG